MFKAWRLGENKTPQTQRDPRGKVKNLYLQQTGKSKQKKKRDKYLLTQLSKNILQNGMETW
jgi:hypothetical protein